MDFPHSFSDASLVNDALDRESSRFQRLEWLGDRALGCSVANTLYLSHPNRSEAELSRCFGRLVNNQKLASISIRLKLPGWDAKTSQRKLADSFEALLGATLLDAGMVAVQKCIEQIYQDEITSPDDDVWVRDAKTQLKEECEKHHITPIFAYSQDDANNYIATCKVKNESSIGKGRSKYKANEVASAVMLDLLLEKSKK